MAPHGVGGKREEEEEKEEESGGGHEPGIKRENAPFLFKKMWQLWGRKSAP